MESKIKLYLGDCLEIMPTLTETDNIITDPPYPDNYQDEYQYQDGIVKILDEFTCRQLVFWSAKIDFPLDYSAIHVWDKVVGIGNYERIFERNGHKQFKVYRAQPITSEIRAIRSKDIFTEHKSQKPIYLMRILVERYSDPGATILDPFMGSGTTGVACVQTGRNFIGIEIEPKYFEIAEKRIKEAQLQMRFDL